MIGGIGGYDPKQNFNIGVGVGGASNRLTDADEAKKAALGIEDDDAAKVGDEQKHPGRKSSPADCETCKNRKYQDGSDESDVSFQNPTHIDPSAAGAAVRAHEQEHVMNAYQKAREDGGKVLSVGVSIHTSVCPECGRVYVSGGLTTSRIAYPADGNDDGDEDEETKKVNATANAASQNPYAQQKNALTTMMNTGMRMNTTF